LGQKCHLILHSESVFSHSREFAGLAQKLCDSGSKNRLDNHNPSIFFTFLPSHTGQMPCGISTLAPLLPRASATNLLTGVVMLDYQAPRDLLKDKVILVTGAGDGIGREAAITYAAHGATVILLGRTSAKLEAVYDQIEAAGYPLPAIVPVDLKGATAAHYRGMAETFAQQFGRLDGVLFNAGLLGTLSPFAHIQEKEWDEVIQVNVKSE